MDKSDDKSTAYEKEAAPESRLGPGGDIDIVDQLRDMRICEGVATLRSEAADEIERLRYELREAYGQIEVLQDLLDDRPVQRP